MCNRYRFTDKIEALARVFLELNALKPRLTPRFNVAPTQLAPVVLPGEDLKAEIQMLRWGLVPSWSKDGKGGFLNARSETVADKPAFRSAYRLRRCLVIAHGFYEWQTLPHGKKQPWHFHRLGDEMMAFAGLWESWQPHPGPAEPVRTFTILTTPANRLIAPLHDRMPVILPPEAWRAWIDPRSAAGQLQPYLAPCDAGAMESWPVTPRMNNVRFESEECLKPIAVDDLELRLE
jgi:putative SOS response-associated peptidase YedK